MKEPLITFRTAKLAKEKGFTCSIAINMGIPTGYRVDGKFTIYPEVSDYPYKHEDSCYAPTQSLLQKWLREKHGLILLPIYTDIIGAKWGYSIYGGITKTYGNSYEEALEEGLYQALLLINGK